jgi:hypothetical protein
VSLVPSFSSQQSKGQKVSMHKRLAREALEKQYLHYDGQSVLKKRGKALQLEKMNAEAAQGAGPGGNFSMDPGSDAHDGGDSELPPLPEFVVTFLERRHGVRALVRQACLELIMTLEHVRKRNEESEERRKRLEIRRAKALSKGQKDGGDSSKGSSSSKAALQSSGGASKKRRRRGDFGDPNGSSDEAKSNEESSEDDEDELIDGVDFNAGPVVEAEVFSGFLRELYTDDQLLFYLHARHVTQRLFGLKLGALKTRVLSDRAAGIGAATGSVDPSAPGRALHDPLCQPTAPGNRKGRREAEGSGGLLRRPGDVLLEPHRNLRDGTLSVCLGKSALKQVARQIALMGYGHDEDGAAKEAKRLAHYIVEVLVPKQGLIGQYKMVPVGVREFRKDATHYEALPVQSWLNILVKVLHEAPEDLVTQGKEGKEPLGGKLLMIEKMQETMVDDEKIAVLEERVEEGKRDLNRCTLKLLKDQRRFEVVTAKLEQLNSHAGEGGADVEELVTRLAVEQGQLRTGLMLGRAEEKRKRAALTELSKEARSIDARREAVWSDIMSSDTMAASGPPVGRGVAAMRRRHALQSDKLRANALTAQSASAVRTFGAWCGRLAKRHEAAKGIAKYFATGWKDDLEAFKEKAIITIQRVFRKRRADRLANADGLAELERRKQAAEELRLKEEAIRRKALAEPCGGRRSSRWSGASGSAC